MPHQGTQPTLERKHGVRRGFLLLACLAPVLAYPALAVSPSPADFVVTDARIYTEDAHHSEQQALAVRGGKIVFVGSSTAVRRWIGPHTKVARLGGRLVLPGLFDSHTHPMLAIKLDVCDLDSASLSLRQISAFVSRCLRRYQVPAGGWLSVQQWNFSDGNQPDPQYPTLRAALDRASTTVAIHLYGNDGHHDAFNSVALAKARNAAGQVVGLSKATLARDFAAYAKVVGVDANGEPNGAVNEAARMLMPAPGVDVAGSFVDGDAIMKARDQIPRLYNGDGITGFLDAAVPPELVPVYRTLEREDVTRRHGGEPALNPGQTISIRDVIDAYTINGARFLRRDAVAGSLEVGKSADFIVLDRDILQLADHGRADDIAGTRMLETWFEGRRVFSHGSTARPAAGRMGVTS